MESRRLTDRDLQILAVVQHKALCLGAIAARVPFTRHPSRVRMALFRLQGLGLAAWDPDGRWRATERGAGLVAAAGLAADHGRAAAS